MTRLNVRGTGYFGTVLLCAVLGALAGLVIFAAFGWLGKEVGWWGIGLLLGLIYGTLVGFSVADRP